MNFNLKQEKFNLWNIKSEMLANLQVVFNQQQNQQAIELKQGMRKLIELEATFLDLKGMAVFHYKRLLRLEELRVNNKDFM